MANLGGAPNIGRGAPGQNFGGGYRAPGQNLGGVGRAPRQNLGGAPKIPKPPKAPKAPKAAAASPAAAAPVTAPGAASQTIPGAPQGSDLDATYYQALAAAQLKANSTINADNLKQSYANTNEQNALAQLAHQQPIDTLNDQEKANEQGLLYSGTLGNQLGELNRA